MNARTAAGLALTIALLPAPSALAFDYLRSPAGSVARRAEGEVVFRMPARIPAGLDRAQVREAVEHALEHWAESSGLVLRLVDGAPDAPTGCGEDGLSLNDIVFVEDGWKRRAGAIAETPVCMGAGSGRIYGADILLNASDFTFAVLPPDHRKGTGIAYDLEAVLVHEVGHALGMAHSDVKDAVMWGGGERGDVSRRVLAEDDVVGVQRLYSMDTGSEEGVGCSSAPGGRSAAGLLALLALLARREPKRSR